MGTLQHRVLVEVRYVILNQAVETWVIRRFGK